ncbi:50S ribosomal protein L44e [Candidatus Micrarchaeota archaeon]|nr:50S ribosomal protein L44e [Candidatus Micrarchaeota archaeon]MBU1930884.1 50S ribosomal protein L44e [Candidatus Micrarchaeota archaeon]
MNIPKTISTYCRKCNKHTPHKLKQFKSGQARTKSRGTRKMEKKHKKGYGGKTKFPATIKKQNKKPNFVAECSVCKQKRPFVIPKRMKKAEIKS